MGIRSPETEPMSDNENICGGYESHSVPLEEELVFSTYGSPLHPKTVFEFSSISPSLSIILAFPFSTHGNSHPLYFLFLSLQNFLSTF